MTQPEDNLLSDADMADRFAALESDGFPQEEVEQLAKEFATFCTGAVAEQMVAKLLEILEAERVCRVATEQVTLLFKSRTPPDYCRASELFAIDLASHGFHVVSGGGWHVNLPDGTELGPMISSVEGEDTDTRLCRLGLLAIWMIAMRSRLPQAPAF